LIHATPVGMWPNSDGCLFQDRIPAGIVMDMVYNPHETQLLKLAQAQKATVIHGIDMLLEQAAHQFEIWTGETAPRSVMKRAIDGQ
jgi:shikimate 5-dehydrogenase